MMRTNREQTRWGPRWRRQAAGIAAGLGALVLSVSALALATALHDRAAEGQVLALRNCAAQSETGCAAP
jgi:hypothetical protein